MDSSVKAVEKLLGYRFQKKELLEHALTHSFYTDSASYERLEFLVEANLGLAISKYLASIYPEIGHRQLTLLRTVNISNERLARVAVRHGLYSYVQCRNLAVLDDKVRDFTEAVQLEDDMKVYGGDVKAPKILADIVKYLAAAVYFDCEFDWKTWWKNFKDFLEPMVTLDVLQQQPQLVNQKEKALQYKISRSMGATSSYGDSEVNTNKDDLIYECMSILNAMDDIDGDSYSKAVTKFSEGMTWRKLFLAMPDHRKRDWVMRL